MDVVEWNPVGRMCSLEDSNMKNMPIGVVVGSARKGSYSKTVAETIVRLMPKTLAPHFLNIADLPIYNEDYDAENKVPEAYARFRKEVGEMRGFLFVTPEYNRSIPPLMKNALDVASRPMGKNAWGGKPGAVVSVSPGALGAFGSNHILRQSMAFLNVFMMQQPEAYIGGVADMINADGAITAEKSLGFLKLIAESFAEWAGHFQK